MGILVNKKSKVIVQGAIGIEGRFHTERMRAYGTNVVAGVDPAAQVKDMDGLPIYTRISDIVRDHGEIDATVVFVPAPFVLDAVTEAVHYGVKLVVCITEGVPVHDVIQMHNLTKARGVRMIGPNCPGLIVPGEAKLGIIPGQICERGPVGVISKSGTLTYEVIQALGMKGLGQSACFGIGGDPLIGTTFVDLLEMFEKDDETKAVVIIGEIGGGAEMQAADYIEKHFSKPVCAFIAGKCAPPEKKMGHAGAIISSKGDTAAEKIEYLQSKGIKTATIPSELGDLVASVL